ncbi:hypothetical protein Trco_002171 [Trichoderma cornu-damae]|uniref:Uncharacterized protein n=1 Tax=Trichoderma cornu-damae TaxID=654480 RepID=A0A9P8QM44_9HYPO|nr:hypothetical protein Trco_002171 [Trichoderma cornu-damae]
MTDSPYFAYLGATPNFTPNLDDATLANFCASRLNDGAGLNENIIPKAHAARALISVVRRSSDVDSLLDDASSPDKNTADA